MEFSENLMRLRRERGLSQEELGNQLGVSRQTVSKWELGQTTPEMAKLIELSRLFDISIDELTGNYREEPFADNTETTGSAGDTFRNSKYEYKSKMRLFGQPLVHIHVGFGSMPRATGIIAIGNRARGIIALGFLPIGLIAIGPVAAGLLLAIGGGAFGGIAIGGLAVGGFAMGGGAIGIVAMGGGAIGVYAMGGGAIGSRVALGGYARAYIAAGNRVSGVIEFPSSVRGNGGFSDIDPEVFKHAIMQTFPGTWKFIAEMFALSVG